MSTHLGVTRREEAVLEALCKIKAKNYPGNIIKLVAADLNMAPQTIYTVLYRLRNRYNRALQFGSDYRKWRKKLGDKYL
jgi:predicted transcriptional regulator